MLTVGHSCCIIPVPALEYALTSRSIGFLNPFTEEYVLEIKSCISFTKEVISRFSILIQWFPYPFLLQYQTGLIIKALLCVLNLVGLGTPPTIPLLLKGFLRYFCLFALPNQFYNYLFCLQKIRVASLLALHSVNLLIYTNTHLWDIVSSHIP